MLPDIMIIFKKKCPFSVKALDEIKALYPSEKSYEDHVVGIEVTPDLQEEFVRFMNDTTAEDGEEKSKYTVPQIWVNQKYIGGWTQFANFLKA